MDQNVERTKRMSYTSLYADLLPDRTWIIYQDQKGHYWFGSNGQGVFRYDGQRLQQWTSANGLTDDDIRGIQEDASGHIYVETPAGVDVFDGKSFQYLNPIQDPSNQWELKEGDLWFNCNSNPHDVYRFDGEHLYELLLPREDLWRALGIENTVRGIGGVNRSPYAVYGIDKDRAGNLWFGTETAGAYRYDGSSFLWFGEPELSTLPDGRVPGVRSILEDRDGYYWLSNLLHKYRVFSENTDLSYEKINGIDNLEKRIGDRLPYFNSGAVAKDSTLWMTSYSGVIWKYDGDSFEQYEVKIKGRHAQIVSIYLDHNGAIWLGTDNVGVLRFDGTQATRFYATK